MHNWEDDPNRPKSPWTGARIAFLIVFVAIFFIVIFSVQ